MRNLYLGLLLLLVLQFAGDMLPRVVATVLYYAGLALVLSGLFQLVTSS
jgi:hypothetical protein